MIRYDYDNPVEGCPDCGCFICECVEPVDPDEAQERCDADHCEECALWGEWQCSVHGEGYGDRAEAYEAEVRAQCDSERDDVKRWLRRLAAVARTMPPDVWVYVASGTVTVMAHDEHGDRARDRDGFDRDAVITQVSGGSWDGGDW